MMTNSVLLLVVLLVCHYLADFCLTWTKLIQSKADGRSLWPIAQHAAVHALLMGGCLLAFGVGIRMAFHAMALELVTHFAIDIAKARLSVANPILANAERKSYWMLYGLDQLLHLFVIVLIWYNCVI